MYTISDVSHSGFPYFENNMSLPLLNLYRTFNVKVKFKVEFLESIPITKAIFHQLINEKFILKVNKTIKNSKLIQFNYTKQFLSNFASNYHLLSPNKFEVTVLFKKLSFRHTSHEYDCVYSLGFNDQILISKIVVLSDHYYKSIKDQKKLTTLNNICNYLKRVDWFKDFIVKIIEEYNSTISLAQHQNNDLQQASNNSVSDQDRAYAMEIDTCDEKESNVNDQGQEGIIITSARIDADWTFAYQEFSKADLEWMKTVQAHDLHDYYVEESNLN